MPNVNPPVDFDLVGIEFWRQCVERKLCATECEECQRMAFPPRVICPSCWGNRLKWRTLSGQGSLYAYSISYGPPIRIWAQVALADQDQMYFRHTEVIRCRPDDLRIGMPLQVAWRDVGVYRVPVWQPTEVAQ